MSDKYHIEDDSKPHFVSFSVVNWIDALTRVEYKDIFVDSLEYCIKEKGMILHAWIIMSNHVHLILSASEGYSISDILRDLKKYTASRIIAAIRDNPKESRKEWMLWMFQRAGNRNSKNTRYQFWQQHNHSFELSTNIMLAQRLHYLHENPVRSGQVYEPQDYVYSSATDYCTTKKGKIAVDYL